jgi:hypothetical protein
MLRRGTVVKLLLSSYPRHPFSAIRVEPVACNPGYLEDAQPWGNIRTFRRGLLSGEVYKPETLVRKKSTQEERARNHLPFRCVSEAATRL